MKTKLLFILTFYFSFFIFSFHQESFGQGTWNSKAPVPTPGRWGSVAFTIGNKGYVGTGDSWGGGPSNDFWEYDPIVNIWTQKANFGGAPRVCAIGFAVGSYGYIGAGTNLPYSPGIIYNDFFKYDPIANTWVQIANPVGLGRFAGVGFSIAGKGYIGTGWNGSSLLQDLWEYNPLINTWTQKSNYGGGVRMDINTAVFVIGNKAYMGTGGDMLHAGGIGNVYNDFWEYDPFVNIWTQKANFAGTPRGGATGFSICSRGFLGSGIDYTQTGNADLWKYNPFTNSWSPVTSFPGLGIPRVDQAVFVINNRAYVATGLQPTFLPGTGPYNDLWEFIPDSVGNVSAAIYSSANPICTGQSVTLSASGGSSYSWANGSTNNTIVISPSATTTYSVIVTDNICSGSDTAVITISVTSIKAAIACQNVCSGNSATLTASGGTNYIWSNGATSNSITVSPAVVTTYSVITSTGSCADTAYCTVNIFSDPVISVSNTTDVSCSGGSDGSATVIAASGTPPYTYLWSPIGGNSPVATGLSAAVYSVIVTDANGCAKIQIVTMNLENAKELYLPNSFSPNGDGENDVLQIYYENYLCIKSLNIVIYNRWGEKVFESSDPYFKWDGSDSKGIFRRNEGSAVFVYYLKATLISGEEIIKQGNISLMR